MAATVRAFSIAYLAALAAIIAIAWAASAFFGFELPGSAMGVVPFVVGVQFAAQAYAKRQGDAPSGGYAWKAAFGMTAAAFAMSFVFIAIGFAAIGPTELLGPIYTELSASGFLMIAAGVFIFYALMARLSFPWLVKSSLKAMQRQK